MYEERMSLSKFQKMVGEVCDMTPHELNRVMRILLCKWKEKSDFENDVKEALDILKEEEKSGKAKVEPEE